MIDDSRLTAWCSLHRRDGPVGPKAVNLVLVYMTPTSHALHSLHLSFPGVVAHSL